MKEKRPNETRKRSKKDHSRLQERGCNELNAKATQRFEKKTSTRPIFYSKINAGQPRTKRAASHAVLVSLPPRSNHACACHMHPYTYCSLCLVFAFHRYFYPTTAAHPGSVLRFFIPERYRWRGQTVRQNTKKKPRLIKVKFCVPKINQYVHYSTYSSSINTTVIGYIFKLKTLCFST